MNKLRWVGLVLWVGGCGSESNPGQIGYIPTGDATIVTTSDAGDDVDIDPQDSGNVSDMSDASLDAQPDAIQDSGAEDVGDDAADAADAADATADMADRCWGERTNLTAGLPCGQTPTSGACNLATQTGCDERQYCTFIFDGMVLRAGCTPIVPQCGFLEFDEVCAERVGQTTNRLGTCEPGSYCPALRPTATQATCARYCELKTGLGCAVEEVCIPIVSGQSAQSVAGYGECSATEVCAL